MKMYFCLSGTDNNHCLSDLEFLLDNNCVQSNQSLHLTSYGKKAFIIMGKTPQILVTPGLHTVRGAIQK